MEGLKKYETRNFEITIDDIRKQFCPNATDKELAIALGVVQSFGLNPYKREVHFIKYGTAPLQIIVGYEVYLKRAERTGDLNGWQVSIGKDDNGTFAKVVIHRKSWNFPFEWIAYENEFTRQVSTWKQMPLFMLRKVAIAQAFRICFSDELGGMPYTKEEQEIINSENHKEKEIERPIPVTKEEKPKELPLKEKKPEEKPNNDIAKDRFIPGKEKELPSKENSSEVDKSLQYKINKITLLMAELGIEGEEIHEITSKIKTKEEADRLLSKYTKMLNDKIRKEIEEKRKNAKKEVKNNG